MTSQSFCLVFHNPDVLLHDAQYGKEYEFEAPVKLLDKLLHSMPQSPDEQLVVVSQVLSVCLYVCLSVSLSKFWLLPLMFCLRCLLLISTLGTRKSSTPRSVIAVSRKCFDVSCCIASVTEFFVAYIFV